MTTIRDGDAHALLQTHCESTEQDAHREELRDFLTQINRAHHLWLPLAIELQFDGADGDDHTRIAPPAALVIAAACGAIVMAPDCCRMTLAFKFIFHALRLIDRIHPDDDGRISQILARQVCAMRAQSPKSFAVMLTRFPGMERRLEGACYPICPAMRVSPAKPALTDTDVHMGDALHTTDTNPSLADQDMGHQQATTADEVTPPYTTPPSTQAAINSGEVLPQHIPISDTRLPSTAQSFGLPTPPSSQPAGASSSAAQSSDAPYKPVGRLRRDTAKAVSSTIHHEKRPRSPTEPSSPRNEPKKKTVFQKAT
ncbi:hypothetical protein FB45DRAFT_23394 [Roridomyces roridus]|uniref:Uncharacterized protein n=1 Tax=Roridomyces roridus TaxID=1738132 RepID=A0AAD7CK80_9AGAR|nr:hypothetical protein FB45DRAFT_23394 [Roridomyces roridus]